MSYEVRKKPQAERDIEECFVYIGEDNLDIAVHFLVAVEDSIEQIGRNPFIGKTCEFIDSKIKINESHNRTNQYDERRH